MITQAQKRVVLFNSNNINNYCTKEQLFASEHHFQREQTLLLLSAFLADTCLSFVSQHQKKNCHYHRSSYP